MDGEKSKNVHQPAPPHYKQQEDLLGTTEIRTCVVVQQDVEGVSRWDRLQMSLIRSSSGIDGFRLPCHRWQDGGKVKASRSGISAQGKEGASSSFSLGAEDDSSSCSIGQKRRHRVLAN